MAAPRLITLAADSRLPARAGWTLEQKIVYRFLENPG
jgi:hypothetical protein